MNGYLIALIVLSAWIAAVYYLNRSKWFERRGMSLMGPMVMWKTRKGRDFIDRVATKKRLWAFYGRLSLWVCAGAMVTIMVLLLWEATIVSQVEEAPSPELILGIPGINPVIPLWYGILGLVVAIVVHEMSHGILTRLGEMKIVSLGVLFFVFPVGAFVEPDEGQLQAAPRGKRAKVFAAGPASNLILAVVVLGLFSGVMMASVQPAHEGALATGVVEGSPAYYADIPQTSVLVSVGGFSVASPDDVDALSGIDPGTDVTVEYYFAGELESADDVAYGMVVSYAVEGYSAHDGGLLAGMVLASLNGTSVRNMDDLRDAMELTSAGQAVDVSVLSYNSTSGAFEPDPDILSLTLSDKHDFYAEYYPDENEDAFIGDGYLGAGFLPLGLNLRDADHYSSLLAHPFEGDNDIGDFSTSWLRLIALPFLDLAPLRSPVTDLYEPSGSMAWMPDSAFWILTNSLYWIFWLNLMIGLTNVLPAVPLDGGYLFRDAFDYLVSRVRPGHTKEQREKVVGSITLAFALMVLFLIVWQLVGPAILN
ncbi:MAG: site-2 protease family protein [Candidatus Thermoplasmatota archaeon]